MNDIFQKFQRGARNGFKPSVRNGFKPFPTFCLLALLAFLAAAATPALAAPGDLVPAFGTGGVDGDGVVTCPNTARPNGAAIDSTSIYVVGWATDDWRTEKRNLSDGKLDISFDFDGIATSNVTTKSDRPSDIAIDSTYLYAVGLTKAPSTPAEPVLWRIEKRNLATGIQSWEKTSAPLIGAGCTGCWTTAKAIVIDSTYMYVVGEGQEGFYRHWRIEKRYLSDGNLDLSFGVGGSDGNGVITNAYSGVNYARPNDIAIDSNYMYVVGIGSTETNSWWRIEKRSLTTGLLETTFGQADGDGEDGVVAITPGGTSAEPYAIAIDPGSNSIYVVGAVYVSAAKRLEWRIEKRDSITGSLSWEQTTDISAYSDEARAIVIIDSNYMYVAGHDSVLGYDNYQWRVERRSLADGNLDLSFGVGGSDGNGVVGSNPSNCTTSLCDFPRDIAIDSNYLYVVGNNDSNWRIEKRESGGGGGPGPSGVDCGLRMYDGTSTVTIDCEDPPVSPLRVYQGTKTYGINVVDPADANASRFRIQTPSGVKALRKQ